MVASYSLQSSKDGGPAPPPQHQDPGVLWPGYAIHLPNQQSRGAQQWQPGVEWAEQFSGAVSKGSICPQEPPLPWEKGWSMWPWTLGPSPQQPTGVMRLVMEASGETVQKYYPNIELLHKGTGELIEYKTCLQVLLYFDYVSIMCNKLDYLLTVKNLLKE